MLRESSAPREPPRLAWVVCVALGTLLMLPDTGWRHSAVQWVKEQVDKFDNVPAQPDLPPRDVPGAPRLALRVNGNSRCLVQLKVNGRGPFDFIVDTGAPEVVLTKAQGRRLGINLTHPDHSGGGWGGGKTEGVFATVDLQLKDFRQDLEVSVESETGFEEGLLGISFIKTLKRFDIANGWCRFWW